MVKILKLTSQPKVCESVNEKSCLKISRRKCCVFTWVYFLKTILSHKCLNLVSETSKGVLRYNKKRGKKGKMNEICWI